MRLGFRPDWTRIVVVDRADVGSITTRPEGSTRWIEHFYVTASVQGKGVGSIVLERVLAETHVGDTKLNVLQRSAARRLYERYGFVSDQEDEVDVFMTLEQVR
jgi:GNAT superfamily N-acetyltransferase